jgi:Protein of unknown function (DUF429)
MHVVGFDPGGLNAFGWAVVALNDTAPSLLACGTCSGAPDALAAARAASPTTPVALAIDAPLFWVTAGDRKADQFVRKMVCAAGGNSGTVSHVNSLRGACLVQGVLITRLAAQIWSNAAITEAHPKALRMVSASAREFESSKCGRIRTEHERDAALAAFAAVSLLTVSGGWHDLAALKSGPFFPGGKRVAYWFPESRT